MKIIVETEEQKQEILEQSKYIPDFLINKDDVKDFGKDWLIGLDSDKAGILMHLYMTPQIIEVNTKKMNNLDKDYCNLLQDILDNGVKKQTRNGEVLSVFGRQIRHSMKDGFPILTTKKMAWKTMVTELLWFLRGDTNIKFLLDNDCHIWDGDCFAHYIKEYEKYKANQK